MGGTILNRSSKGVWIRGDDKLHWLSSGASTRDLGIRDADGLLLDGRRVLLESRRTRLGGGGVWSEGAIKVCDLGTLTVQNGDGRNYDLVARISGLGFLCGREAAGYKSPSWCTGLPGWRIIDLEVGTGRNGIY